MGRSTMSPNNDHSRNGFNLFKGQLASTEEQRRFLAMLGECQSVIFNICLLFTNRQYDSVQDMYQDIVYNLWKAWPSFRKRSSEATWVYSIALKTAVQAQRDSTKRPVLFAINDKILETLADEDANLRYDKLYKLIDRLDSEEKKLIFLYIDRHPLKEIADILGISEDAVKQRILRLKNKLQKMKNLEI